MFKLEIENDLRDGKTLDNNLKIAISKIINEIVDERVINSDSNLTDGIIKAFEEIFTGNKEVGKGICTLLEQAFNAILGAREGEEKRFYKYLVTVEYPSIVRYDMIFWNRKISSTTIKKHIENAVVCVATKSSVDVKKLDFNTFLALYSEVLNLAFKDSDKDIKKAIAEAKEIYKMYVPEEKQNIDINKSYNDLITYENHFITQKEENVYYGDIYSDYL